MHTLTNLNGQPMAALPVLRVPLTRPFVWLRRGWDDLRHNPSASLAYGFLVSAMGALILAFWSHPFFVAASVTGFLLVGPLLTTGLCELSRLRANGDKTGFEVSLSALGRNRDALLRFAVGLLVIGAAWFAASSLMLYLVLGSAGPTLESTIWGSLFDQISTAQVLSYVAVGGILAAIVFARSVVSVPLIIDRQTDAGTAVQTSLRVALSNLPAMIVWAALIVVLVGFGFATFLIGMIVVFPLLGHATWHAYRDLVA
jgi:uncharacterized membrane protein